MRQQSGCDIWHKLASIDRLRTIALGGAFLAMVLGPKLTPFLLAAAVLAAILQFDAAARKELATLMRAPGVAALGLACCYLLTSSLWALNPAVSLRQAAFVSALLIGGMFITALYASYAAQIIGRLGRVSALGLVLGATFLAFELAFDFIVIKAVYHNAPILVGNNNPSLIHESRKGTVVLSYLLNRNIALLMALFWPALLIISRQFAPGARNLLAAALIGATGTAIVLSANETAKLALIVSTGAFAAAWAWPKLSHWGGVAAWAALSLFIVPLIAGMVWLALAESSFVPLSGKARIYIWERIAGKVMDRPLTGIGIRSMRFAEHGLSGPKRRARDVPREALSERNVKRLSQSPRLHPHNAYLQVWYELGAIGAGLLFAIGLIFLRRIQGYDDRSRVFAFAWFTALATIALTGHGAWQGWLVAGFAWSSLLLVLGRRAATPSRADLRPDNVSGGP